ncbi:MAG: acetyltransferase [Fimbriimonadales bacterium]
MSGREVVVLGAGGHAKVVISALRAAGQVPVGVFDDRRELWGHSVLGVSVLGPVVEAASKEHPAIIAIGDNAVRERLADALALEWIAVVHPHAWVDPTAHLGEGTVVFAGAVVQPDVKIGRHAIVNTSASVDHDGQIGEFAQIAPGAHLGGNVVLRQGAFVGLGASVIQGMEIGEWSIVGAGATVVGDVPPRTTVLGTPARPRQS